MSDHEDTGNVPPATASASFSESSATASAQRRWGQRRLRMRMLTVTLLTCIVYIVEIHQLHAAGEFTLFAKQVLNFVVSSTVFPLCSILTCVLGLTCVWSVTQGGLALLLSLAVVSLAWCWWLLAAERLEFETYCWLPQDFCPKRGGIQWYVGSLAFVPPFVTGLLESVWRPFRACYCVLRCLMTSGEYVRPLCDCEEGEVIMWFRLVVWLPFRAAWQCRRGEAGEVIRNDAILEYLHFAFFPNFMRKVDLVYRRVRPYLRISSALLAWRLPSLDPVDYAILALSIYDFFSQGESRATMESQMNSVLQDAMAHPFSARMQEVAAVASLRRQLSRIVAPSQHAGLREKRKLLVAECRRTVEESLQRQTIITVSRESLLEDSFKELNSISNGGLLSKGLQVAFKDEFGMDMGGVRRDWFDSVARAAMTGASDPHGISLLHIDRADAAAMPRMAAECGRKRGVEDHGNQPPALKRRLQDGSALGVSRNETCSLRSFEDRCRQLVALGRFIALAVVHESPLPISLDLVVCKYLLGRAVNVQDVFRCDPDFCTHRVQAVLKKGGVEQMEAVLMEPLHFLSAPTQARPTPVELKTGGASLRVTEGNKQEYLQLLCEEHLCGGIRQELQCLLQGFWTLLPKVELKNVCLTPVELSVLIAGVSKLNPEEWRQHSSSGDSQVHQWFWQLIQEWSDEQRAKLLHFTTGSSRLPFGSFQQLQPQFTVNVVPDSRDRLPTAHTCVNAINLPSYTSFQKLKARLETAVDQEGFGFL